MPTVVHAIAVTVYAMGGVVCHQRPERSFHWNGQPWPVCARCAGIYMGVALGVLLAGRMRHRRLPDATRVRQWLLASALPSAATLAFEWSTGAMPGHAWRAIAGGVMGCVATVLIVLYVREAASATAPAPPRA